MERMAGCILTLFIFGLVILCGAFGLVLSDATDTPEEVWALWRGAMGTIPLTGFAALWIVSLKAKASVGLRRLLGGLATLVGGLLTLYWGNQALAARENSLLAQGNMVAGMALIPALLLLSAGLTLLFSTRPTKTE